MSIIFVFYQFVVCLCAAASVSASTLSATPNSSRPNRVRPNSRCRVIIIKIIIIVVTVMEMLYGIIEAGAGGGRPSLLHSAGRRNVVVLPPLSIYREYEYWE